MRFHMYKDTSLYRCYSTPIRNFASLIPINIGYFFFLNNKTQRKSCDDVFCLCLACPEAKDARVFHRILVTSPHLTPSLKNRIAKYRATYGMLSWSALLECRWERYRWHYSHWFPLLRLLADVNRFCGERFESGAKAGEHVALLILYVILLHGMCRLVSALHRMVTESQYGLQLRYGAWESHLTLSVCCARPGEPISSHQQAMKGSDWWFSRAVGPTFSTLFAFSMVCLLHDASWVLRHVSRFRRM